MAGLTIPKKNVSLFILTMAEKNGVHYTENKLDRVARVVTRLAGDDVKPDEVEGLLIHLRRQGLIEGSEMVILHSRYLDEVEAKAAKETKSKAVSKPRVFAAR